jgi:ankyrin repeat protein
MITTINTIPRTIYSPGVEHQSAEDAEDEDTFTPLQSASSLGNLSLVSDLLSNNTDPSELPKGWYGKTALQAASLHGHLPVIDILITTGAIIHAPGGNNGGLTPLALAAGAGHIQSWTVYPAQVRMSTVLRIDTWDVPRYKLHLKEDIKPSC